MISSVHKELLRHTITPSGMCTCGARMGSNRFRHWRTVVRTRIEHPSMTADRHSENN